jgi:hypothetical protein
MDNLQGGLARPIPLGKCQPSLTDDAPLLSALPRVVIGYAIRIPRKTHNCAEGKRNHMNRSERALRLSDGQVKASKRKEAADGRRPRECQGAVTVSKYPTMSYPAVSIA